MRRNIFDLVATAISIWAFAAGGNSREQGRLQNHILFWHKNDYRDAEAIGHRT